MLVALVLMGLLTVLGTSTLNIAGVDQRIAIQNRKHMLILNTSLAGTEHARSTLAWRLPQDFGWDDSGVVGNYITVAESEVDFKGSTYAHNQGVYWVDATFHRCGNPPPGYSAEAGANAFSSTYWEMTSRARMRDDANRNMNESRSTSSMMLRRVVPGDCKIR